MIREDLLEFQYYLNRLSMFMKESYGITEQTELFYRQLKTVNEQFDIFFNNLKIFDDKIVFLSDFLDLIGSYFECYRQFTIQLNGSYIQINLQNNREFLDYIRCQIIKQNFKGTYDEIKRLYTHYENREIKSGLVDLQFDYVLLQEDQESLSCRIYFSNYNNYTEQIKNLFLAGYLTIESMGINYDRECINIYDISTFASDETLSLSNGDYYQLNGTPTIYYQWSSLGYWYESEQSGEGRFLGEINSTSEIPNFDDYYKFDIGRFA